MSNRDPFEFQIMKLANKYQRIMRAAIRGAVQDVVADAQEVRPSPLVPGGTGRMRVRTGFLRASIQAAIGAIPSGPSDNPNKGKSEIIYPLGSQLDGLPVSAVLLQWNAGLERGEDKTLVIGWTANYARVRESYDQFMGLAVQKWPQFVEKNVKDAKNRIR